MYFGPNLKSDRAILEVRPSVSDLKRDASRHVRFASPTNIFPSDSEQSSDSRGAIDGETAHALFDSSQYGFGFVSTSHRRHPSRSPDRPVRFALHIINATVRISVSI